MKGQFRLRIPIPIVALVITLGLLITLLVGWVLILVENYILTTFTGDAEGHWYILAIGCVFFVVIMVSLVVLTRFLVIHRARNRAQGVLLDAVTHELKSPLASIKLLSETLKLRDLPEDKVTSLREMIAEDIERLDAIIDHMLEAGRLEHRKRAYDIEPVDLNGVVTEVITQVSRRRGLDFEPDLNLDGCADSFLTDRPALELILFNLLDNAVKYSTGRPLVQLTICVNEQNRLSISIADEGRGLERRQLRRIFKRFHRVDDTESGVVKDGVGLGLFLVDSLVRGLGGRIWAQSDGIGEGTTFNLVIPEGRSMILD